MTSCSVSGCDRSVHARSYCWKHYLRWRKRGSTDDLPIKRYRMRRTRSSSGSHMEHVQIAERALGKPLPAGAEVHHVNEIKSDNSPGNLVVCPNRSYHRLLHIRTAALNACGNANWRKCSYCQQYGAPGDVLNDGYKSFHYACRSSYMKTRYYQAEAV